MTSYDESELEFASGLGPEAAAAAAAAAAAVTEDDNPPAIQPPEDGPFTLPGGFRRLKVGSGPMQFETVTTAWVKELNGYDEEHIAKARNKGSQGAFLEAILECGVEKLGGTEPTKEDFQALLVGDRDALILEISRATYGNDLEYENFPCQFCGEMLDFTVHKDEDIPTTRLASPDDAEFTVTLRSGEEVTVHLPSCEEQKFALDTESSAEFNTILIAHTTFGGDLDQAKSLGIKDRQTILKELGERSPGPRYNEVTFEHPECGNTNRLAVTLSHLFLGL